MRATISAFFMLGASFSLVTLALVGCFTAAQAATSVWLVPSVMLGFLVSRIFVRHVDKSRGALKRAVLGVSAVAALALLLKPLL